LKNLSLDVLGHEMTPITDLIGTGRKQITFDQVPIEAAVPYAAADADMTGRLRTILEPAVASQGLTPLLADMEIPLVPVLVTMQRHGIKVDAGALHEMSRDLNEQMQQVEVDLYNSIGHTVNINSPQQLSDLLFKELALPHSKRTKTGYSTDANSLEGLKGVHPVVDNILEYRQLSKLKSTYVDALPEMINPRTGRIHTSCPTSLDRGGPTPPPNPPRRTGPGNAPPGWPHGTHRTAFLSGLCGREDASYRPSALSYQFLNHRNTSGVHSRLQPVETATPRSRGMQTAF